MDANKLARLKAIRYKIKDCCFNCVNANHFNREGFSTCKMHHYTHEKHTDSVRQLSIYATGSCPYHRFKNIETIHDFAEFLEEG